MQELESEQDFRCVEPRSVRLESSSLLDVEHEVAAVQIFHHEEQVRLEQSE